MFQKLLKSGIFVSTLTLLSRILGLARDVLMGIYWGASAELDAFLVAFKIPNLFRRLLGEGAFSQALIPVLSSYQAQKNTEVLQNVISVILGNYLLVLLLLSLLGSYFSAQLIVIVAPGFVENSEQFALAANLLSITFPYLFFLGLTSYYSALLQSKEYFVLPTLSPIILNCVFIIAMLLNSEHIMVLAWGCLIAGFFQVLYQMPLTYNLRMLVMPRVHFLHKASKQLFSLMLPIFLSAGIVQLNLIINTIFASWLVSGSISWLYYADRLLELPLGLFAATLGVILLPVMSRYHASDNEKAFHHTFQWGLRLAIFLSIPAMLALFVLSNSVTTTLFLYGEMNQEDIKMISNALQVYAFALPAMVLMKVVLSVYYTRKMTKMLVPFTLCAVGVNIAVNLCLIEQYGHVALAWGVTLSSWMHILLLMGYLVKYHFVPDRHTLLFGLKVICASCVMLWGIYEFNELIIWVDLWVFTRVLCLLSLCTFGLILYLAFLKLLRVPLKSMLTEQQ